ncbi:hypothetical protein [Streptomyces spirodelae]|uniref:Uncharacterized protein n=1 Tax=Streptomyces spirodelae TaxID=2812904 RepID=A0ABS3WWF6_9ACTN|nr:hypothetical protein [Streptomyces spirodelae]MBO8187383.1 hypothetical protein [Streptomyces spirodelae]
MHNLIRRTVHRLSLLLAPGTGTHRAGPRKARPALTTRPTSARLPSHRTPYARLRLAGLGEASPVPVLDGEAIPLVRPYLVAHEEEQQRAQRQRRQAQQQRHRRRTLVLAADFGIDLDQHLIGAGGLEGRAA